MQSQIDLSFVRSQFPAFSEPTLKDFAHFENAGGSYACGQTIEHLDRYYRETKLQPYYDFAPSRRGGELMDQARARLASWMNVAADEVHFGPSTSINHYVVAQALREYLKPGDEFIVTNQDHEANVGVWRRLESDGVVIREWPVDPETGELDPAGLTDLLNEKTRVVAFTHCSNLVGSIHPVRQLTDLVHEAGALAVVDGVSFAPHGIPDPVELGADIYTYSTYKTYGPHLGVMYMASSLNETLPNQGHYFNAGKATARFTPAGPDHAQVAAVNGVVDYLELLHDHHYGNDASPQEKRARVSRLMHDHELRLLPPLLDFVASHRKTRLIGRPDTKNRAPTVAFAIDGQAPAELGRRLGDQGIGVGVGDFYARRLVEALGIDPAHGVVRTSFVHYTSPEEVTRLIGALDEML